MNNGGDVLARGAQSAQFGRADITQFEDDFIYMSVEDICNKYGLSQADYDMHQAARVDGKHLPDLRPTSEKEELGIGFSISDHRSSYLTDIQEVKPVAAVAKKFPKREFERQHPILDRLLVMVISDDPNEELLEDGSTRNKRTGLITAAKYRQHSNVGIVLAIGQAVVMGGIRFPLTDFVKVGDKVVYGDYNSEAYKISDEKAREICDGIGVNFEPSPLGLRIIRIQDIRTVAPVKRTVLLSELETFTPFTDIEQDGV